MTPIVMSIDTNGNRRLVGTWPERTVVAGELIRDKKLAGVIIASSSIHFGLANAWAHYRLDRYDGGLDVYEYTCVECGYAQDAA